jgi:hypothetical protein
MKPQQQKNTAIAYTWKASRILNRKPQGLAYPKEDMVTANYYNTGDNFS